MNKGGMGISSEHQPFSSETALEYEQERLVDNQQSKDVPTLSIRP